MANKHLNIVDLGTTGSGWQTATPIGDTHISKIKDRSAKTSNSLNAIPSPFSRLHVFETAFKLVTEDIREQADRTATVYKELVSDCLDGLELLYNKKYHESQGDTIEIVKWKKEQHLVALEKSEHKAQQIFAKTLEMYLAQDFSEDFTEISIIKYRDMVLAGTSPFSLLFTSPGLDKKDGNFRNLRLKNEFKLINPATGYTYFSRITLFDKRSAGFRRYLIELFQENVQLQNSAEAVWNYLNEFPLPSGNEAAARTEPIRTPAAGTLSIMGAELKQNNDDNALDIFNDHIIKVPYKINREKFFTPTYAGEKPSEEMARQYDFLLPVKAEFLSRIALQDIPRLITYETAGEDRLKVTVKNPNNGKQQWEKTYMVNHTDKRDGEVIDFVKSLSLKFTVGIFPFLKVIDSEGSDYSANSAYNDFYKILLGLDSENEFLSNENFNLRFLMVNRNENGIEEIPEGETKVNVKRYDRTKYENNSGTASIYFQVNNSCFDAIQLRMPPCADISAPSGLIVPNWNKKVIKPKGFDFSVDFGTTNTFIAYTDDQSHTTKPKAFDITTADMQMVMLAKPGDQRHTTVTQSFKGGNIAQIISQVVQHEFVPSVILKEEDDVFSIPFRTAVFEKQNLGESEYSLLDNINVHFAYQRAAMMVGANAADSQRFEPNLKWRISNDRISKVRVDLFLEQILRMIRYKVLLNGGDPSRTNITWFIPQSLTPGAIRDYEQLWQKHFSGTLKSTGRLIKVSESEAPFYYLEKGAVIEDFKSVLNIDIGGGSTDVMLFADKKPLIGTSFNFAGNVFWGNGYSDFKDGNDNGIFKDLNEVIYNRIKPTFLKSSHEELVRKSSTDEIINFWIANDSKTEILKELNSHKYRFAYLLHFTSILYHCAQFIKANQQASPTCVVFSGNGSKYIDFIHDEERLSQIAGFFFRKVIDREAKNPQIILPKADRKESTCYGGIYKNNNINPATKTYLGTTPDFPGLGEIQTYQDLFNTPAANLDVEKNVGEFVNTLTELNNEMNFKAHFSIDYKVELLRKYLLSYLSQNLAAGFSKRKTKVAGEDQISDTLFFYPITGFIYQITHLTKEKLEEFEPKQNLYSNCPDGRGLFLTQRLKAEKTFDAVYKITISESNKQEAQFTIIDETSVFRRAISSIEEILSPVCEYPEFPNNKDQVIQIVSPGRLILRENDWVVDKNLEIKFI